MSPFESKFANAGLRAASNYERKFRKYVPFAELIDALRRQAAFDVPLKFVLDRDSESSGFFKRGPLWDFGNAGVRFEKKATEGSQPTLVVTWSNDVEQKTLQETLDELKGLGFDEHASVSIQLVAPSGECKVSRFGNGIAVAKDNAIVLFTGAWQDC